MFDSEQRLLTVLVLVAFVGSGLGALAVGSSSPVGHPASRMPFTWSHLSTQGTKAGKAPNWAGYAIKTATGAVSDIKATWQVPQINANCPSTVRYSAFWIGIDGDGSSTIEQIGTSTDCYSGSPVYYAWYQLYPASPASISLTISPTDRMSAEVQYSSSTAKFTLTIKDTTTGYSYSKTAAVPGAKRASAEWIAEASVHLRVLQPLTNFGWVTFRNAATTISGHTHSISGFSNTAITMWNLAGTKVKASVGSLTYAGSTFQVTWKSSGP